MICHDGKERTVYLESFVPENKLTKLEDCDVARLMLSGDMCKHDNCRSPQIIYDEPGYMYDNRYCAICGTGLGSI